MYFKLNLALKYKMFIKVNYYEKVYLTFYFRIIT